MLTTTPTAETVLDLGGKLHGHVIGRQPFHGPVQFRRMDLPLSERLDWDTALRTFASFYTQTDIDPRGFRFEDAETGQVHSTKGNVPFQCAGGCDRVFEVTFVPQLQLCRLCLRRLLGPPDSQQCLFVVGGDLVAIQSVNNPDWTLQVAQQPTLSMTGAPAQATLRSHMHEGVRYLGVFAYVAGQVCALVQPRGQAPWAIMAPQRDFNTSTWFIRGNTCPPGDVIGEINQSLQALLPTS